MKRFIYAMMFVAYFAFMAVSCGSSEHSHEHGEHSHEHGEHTHSHDKEHVEQEEFVVEDSTKTSTNEEHDHDHDDHDHEH